MTINFGMKLKEFQSKNQSKNCRREFETNTGWSKGGQLIFPSGHMRNWVCFPSQQPSSSEPVSYVFPWENQFPTPI